MCVCMYIYIYTTVMANNVLLRQMTCGYTAGVLFNNCVHYFLNIHGTMELFNKCMICQDCINKITIDLPILLYLNVAQN